METERQTERHKESETEERNRDRDKERKKETEKYLQRISESDQSCMDAFVRQKESEPEETEESQG